MIATRSSNSTGQRFFQAHTLVVLEKQLTFIGGSMTKTSEVKIRGKSCLEFNYIYPSGASLAAVGILGMDGLICKQEGNELDVYIFNTNTANRIIDFYNVRMKKLEPGQVLFFTASEEPGSGDDLLGVALDKLNLFRDDASAIAFADSFFPNRNYGFFLNSVPLVHEDLFVKGPSHE